MVEAFLTPGAGDLALVNRFGEPVVAERAGRKASLARPLRPDGVDPAWRAFVDDTLAAIAVELPRRAGGGRPATGGSSVPTTRCPTRRRGWSTRRSRASPA